MLTNDIISFEQLGPDTIENTYQISKYENDSQKSVTGHHNKRQH